MFKSIGLVTLHNVDHLDEIVTETTVAVGLRARAVFLASDIFTACTCSTNIVPATNSLTSHFMICPPYMYKQWIDYEV